ncbi:MAG: RibD family protein, partial [Chitinophagaceae bacterium]|nr:RibD family protein [Chitinophagaceae bacterium]
ERLLISNEYTNRLVHRWRSEEAAILVGTNTALLDDPELTTRLWPGKSPVRLVVDIDLKLPSSAKIFNKEAPTVIFNSVKQEEEENILYYRIPKGSSLIHQLLNALYKLKIQSVLVEGGAKLLQSFIDDGLWDEARIINNEQLIINNGLDAPILKNAEKISGQKLLSDKIAIYKLKHS